MEVKPRIVVVGLGYVGLPLALALADQFETIGFDSDEGRIGELVGHHDCTRQVAPERLAASSLSVTSDAGEIAPADVYIIAVPTPVDADNTPDLSIVDAATRIVGAMLDPGRRPIVCYESTVYPGVTEHRCGPILEAVSGLTRSRDFFLGYSPERINPGDRAHAIERILKVVAGENDAVTARLSAIYGAVTSGGIHTAPSIQVAEAAKVIENAQRDINIAFMNDIAQIFSVLDISIWDVLKTARTKWNFLPFEPGLVGGHCIGVDPYYLLHRAAEVGHDSAIIRSARAINDGMAGWVAKQISRLLAPGAAVLVLGLTFKEDLPDLRNTKVADVIAQLQALGHRVDVSDPLADVTLANLQYGLAMTEVPTDGAYDAVVIAVAHRQYRSAGVEGAVRYLAIGGLLADVKGLFTPGDIPEGIRYWRL